MTLNTDSAVVFATIPFATAVQRVLILDCDIRYGDGTEQILNRLGLTESITNATFGCWFHQPADASAYLQVNQRTNRAIPYTSIPRNHRSDIPPEDCDTNCQTHLTLVCRPYVLHLPSALDLWRVLVPSALPDSTRPRSLTS
jgi:hypothetical protein